MPRKIKVVTTCFHEEKRKGASVEMNLQAAKELLATAKALQPDLVCLPEIFLETGIPAEQRGASENMTERIFEMLASEARNLGSYVVASVYDWVDGRKYNMAWVIDPKGVLVGKYAKYHPTIGEMHRMGVTPGTGVPTIDTEFGKLGIAICYDIGWPGLWATLHEKGAELVIWPSAYDGGFTLQAYAWQHQYFVVSSVRTNHSKIIDKTGRILSSTSRWSPLTSQVIDLEKEIFHIDDQYFRLEELQRRLGSAVTIEAFSEENIFTLESNSDDWPLSRICQEFGLETYRDYHRRAQTEQDKIRRQC